MTPDESMELAGYMNLTIACIVCGEEWGYPILQTSAEQLLSEIVSLGWQIKEFPEITGPICHECLKDSEDDQAQAVKSFWEVKYLPDTFEV